MRIDPNKFEAIRAEYMRARVAYVEANNSFKAAEGGLNAARDRMHDGAQKLRDYWHECADLKPGELPGMY